MEVFLLFLGRREHLGDASLCIIRHGVLQVEFQHIADGAHDGIEYDIADFGEGCGSDGVHVAMVAFFLNQS